MQFTRREILASVPLTGSALAMPQGPRKRNPSDVFRVGVLNVGTYSHLTEFWAPPMNPRNNGRDMLLTGMRITHCWDISPDRSAAFAKTYGCEAVKEFDGMAGKVDGVISGGYYCHPWNHILHKPYLEAGLPNLVNRPFTNSLKKASEMLHCAAEHKASLLVPSAYEFNDAIARAKAWAKTKKVSGYSAANSQDDYPTHGTHGVYLVCRAIAEAGFPVVSVSSRAKNWYTPPAALTFEHTDNQGRSFFGSLHQLPHSAGSIEIHAPDEYGGKKFLIEMGSDPPFNRTEFWVPLIWVYQTMALHGEMPQTFEQIWHKTQVFMAGWRSMLAGDGKPVRLNEVPEDWEAPAELPTHPNDDDYQLFKKKFG